MKSENYIVIQGWMCNELQLKGNDLLVYALIYGFSQDGESEFSGGRSYIADTFNISLPTVDKSLKTLVDKGLIERVTLEINNVTFNHYKTILGAVKKLYGGGKETLPNNINNNKANNNVVISKDITTANDSDTMFNFGKKTPKKPNLYQQCVNIIDDFISNYSVDRNILINYLNVGLEMGYILGANQWKGMLNTTLVKAYQNSDHNIDMEDIVQRSIDRSYKTFYPIDNKTYYSKQTPPDNVQSIKITDEERGELQRLADEREKNGQIGYY